MNSTRSSLLSHLPSNFHQGPCMHKYGIDIDNYPYGLVAEFPLVPHRGTVGNSYRYQCHTCACKGRPRPARTRSATTHVAIDRVPQRGTSNTNTTKGELVELYRLLHALLVAGFAPATADSRQSSLVLPPHQPQLCWGPCVARTVDEVPLLEGRGRTRDD